MFRFHSWAQSWRICSNLFIDSTDNKRFLSLFYSTGWQHERGHWRDSTRRTPPRSSHPVQSSIRRRCHVWYVRCDWGNRKIWTNFACCLTMIRWNVSVLETVAADQIDLPPCRWRIADVSDTRFVAVVEAEGGLCSVVGIHLIGGKKNKITCEWECYSFCGWVEIPFSESFEPPETGSLVD